MIQMEDRIGSAIAVLNKIISRWRAWCSFDIIEDLSQFTYIPKMILENPLMEQREKRVSSIFMVDHGGLKKSGRDKRKLDGSQGFEDQDLSTFSRLKKKICISDKDFQFLMCSSFRVSRDELETGVEPVVANLVDDLPQRDAVLIKEFVEFCKYVEKHERNLSAGCSTKKDKEENKYEEAALNKFEDKRFELDIVLNHLRSAIDHAEKLQKLVVEITELALKTPIDLENYFNILDPPDLSSSRLWRSMQGSERYSG
ncbi:hypothetical protein FEM48_Zijuj07G0059800 [Ziziphus jujuba var. spinosa]|uniref:Histone deacetylase interacting domain-containing protein n=1 Tax=Ziziphus jujuba var. spinosa TaxID=714518 RepID=A0A978V2V9_ZIZJJ|nr:hypothetical protein FEM48_Zijuj07G0059800 [Ziziphus jujuba var. spinosa]